MADYFIGDVQGCFTPLMELLDVIAFDAEQDRLIFCGDLVNRGGRSLDVMRWVYANQRCCDTVLGNHDLSLLSKVYAGNNKISNKEFKAIAQAPDADLLLRWLLKRPLFIEHGDFLVIHAGLYPLWGIKKFKRLASVTWEAMQQNPVDFFAHMYGNRPNRWSSDLSETEQHRFVSNACTRMRFVKANGALNFSQNGPASKIKNLMPWFELQRSKPLKKHVVFGHWSALGLYQGKQVTCLDTGKVWGGQLTAMRAHDGQIFSV